jgi:hypothetical protein
MGSDQIGLFKIVALLYDGFVLLFFSFPFWPSILWIGDDLEVSFYESYCFGRFDTTILANLVTLAATLPNFAGCFFKRFVLLLE